MNQEQKVACTAEIQDRFDRAKVAVLTDFRGLQAGQLDRLRRDVRAADGVYHVAKNTLTRRAIGESAGKLGTMLTGPTAIVFGFQDPVSVVKVVVRFAKEYETFTIKGGLLDGEVLTPDGVQALAELPSKEELQARLLAVLQAPAVRLLRTMQEPAARLAYLLEALRRRQAEGQGGEG